MMASPLNVNTDARVKRKYAEDADMDADAQRGNAAESAAPLSAASSASPTYASVKRFKTLTLQSGGADEPAMSFGVPPQRPATAVVPPIAMLDKVLPTLDQSQLVQILQRLLAAQPQLRAPVAALLPRPTLATVRPQLERAERRLQAAYPYHRDANAGADGSDYAFNRARASLAALRDDILHYLPYFTNPDSFAPDHKVDFPLHAFDYLELCTQMVHRIPAWANANHYRELQQPLYTQLGIHWLTVVRATTRAVRDDGRFFAADLVAQWQRQLHAHVRRLCQAFPAFDEALATLMRDLGWVADSHIQSPGSRRV